MATFSDSDSEDEYITNDSISYYSITSPQKSFSSLAEALSYDKSLDFDLLEFLPSPTDEDFYEKTIITINKCRSFIAQNGGDSIESLKEQLQNKEGSDENFFRPILEDDAFLMYIDDLEHMKSEGSNTQEEAALDASPGDIDESETMTQLQMKIKALEEQLNRASSYITKMVDDEETSSTKKSGPDNDTYYFSSYSHSSIHEDMLKDRIRTEAYQNAILNNKHIFEGKTVIDIGCGTGILSLFAAKAGAKKIIAIDASDMHKEAAEIVTLNGYDKVIQVVHGKVEDLIKNNQLPLEKDEKVDVVISEWMGYALFFETMLPSVMAARDALMKEVSEGATMWPNRSTVYLEGATDHRIDYWSDVYGFDMSVMKDRVIKEVRKEASVEIVNADDIGTNRDEIIVHDLNNCRDEDLDFEVPFELKPKRDGQRIDKLVISFDIDFDIAGATKTSFSTGCQTQPTHWKQVTLWFDPTVGVPVLRANEILKGTFRMARNDINPRDMDFLVRWEVGLKEDGNALFEKRIEGTIMSKLGSN